jgi:hypothetical protein
MNFNMEEMNLICIFNTDSKAALVRDIRSAIPDVYDPDLRDIMNSTISKLEKLTDEEFEHIVFYAEEYDETGEQEEKN